MSRAQAPAHPSLMIRTHFSLALLLVVGLPAAAHAQGADAPFTAAERRALTAGELVRRNISRTEGRHAMYGGTSWMRVRAPIERVWALVEDPATYPRLIPSLATTRVVEERGADRVVHMHHDYAIATTDYYVRMRFDRDRWTMRFELDDSRPHDTLRSGRGFIQLSSYRGDTIVSWGMLADVGAGVIVQIFGPVLNERLLLPPRCVRDELEPGRENTCAP